MHQPIYWNDQLRSGGVDRYEYAWESIQQTDGGATNPENNLRDIFGKDDRVAAYQFRPRDTVGSIGGAHPNSGVLMSYSGALMENINSLGQASQLGYGPGWAAPMDQANEWSTPGGKTRMDIVNFSYHHALMGLHNPETVFMELKLHQEKVAQVFGPGAVSRGYFPSEMSFSIRQIPILEDLGIQWAVVSGEHIARACPDFPLVLGSGGVNCAPPNRADQINPQGEQFIRATISRGSSPVNANPLSYQAAYTQYVDPETGTVHKLIVVPADQSQGWRDGFQCIDASFLSELTARNDPSQPSLVLLSHDGDNAFGGGFSYYNECVPNLATDAAGRGGEVTSIEQYLTDFPPDTSDVIHVEDGAWVNADSDFGSPSYINWNYPLLNSNGQHDPENGWHEKPRDMAIFTETLNRILTAQQIAEDTTSYQLNFAKILQPDGSTNPVDRAWHYYLGSLDSGNVYFGPALDLEVKATIGCNEAFEHVDPILAANPTEDRTPPSIWLPQRFPYNPGSLNFGVEFGYQQFFDDGDFHIWTFVADVSGPSTSILKYRIDADGANPLASTQNETFAGGAEVGSWVSLPMSGRDFPKGLPAGYNNGAINFFELPEHIARHYSVEVTGLREVLIDYYIEATDTRGNVAKSPIQHVYIGDGSGSTPGGNSVVTVAPDPPIVGQSVTVSYDATGRNLADAAQVFIHHGFNDWATVFADASMSNVGAEVWEYAYTVNPAATQIDMVFNNGAGTWDNNGGQDWHINTSSTPTPPVAEFSGLPRSGAAPLMVNFTDASTGGPTSWTWDFDGDSAPDSSQRNPAFTYNTPGTYTVTLTAANGEGSDDETKIDYITVAAPVAPAADFSADPTSGAAPLTVNFTDLSASDPAGWAWDFENDGTTDSTQRNPQFTYSTPGAYTVSLTASNAQGSDSEIKIDLIAVAPPPPPSIAINKTTIVAAAPIGSGTVADSFTVANGGSGALDYEIALDFIDDATRAEINGIVLNLTTSPGPPVTPQMDTNSDGVIDVGDIANALAQVPSDWLAINPGSGSSTGEADQIDVAFNSAGLALGAYAARIVISADTDISPRTITVTFEITDAIPSETTVVPNPPQAGQPARVWYRQTGGPLDGAAGVVLHWGINGGLAQGGAWENVTDTPMTESGASPGMWFADTSIPAGATSLNFVTNNGSGTWDNNANQDWNFATAGP